MRRSGPHSTARQTRRASAIGGAFRIGAISMFIGAGAFASAPAGVADVEFRRQPYFVAGNDTSVWIALVGERDGQSIVRLMYGDDVAPTVFTSPTLPDRFGELQALAATEESAVLVYADGTIEAQSFLRSEIRPVWPAVRPPMAVCGDAVGPDVYALADGESVRLARPPTTTATRPTTKGAATTQAWVTVPRGPVVLRLRHRRWDYVAALPESLRGAGRWRIAARGGRVDAYGLREGSGGIEDVRCASLLDGNWSEAQRVAPSAGSGREGSCAALWVSADPHGPLVVRAEAIGSDARTCRLQVMWRKEQTWYASEPLRDDEGELRVDPRRLAAAVGRKALHLVRRDDDGTIRVGLSALDGDRTVRWSAVRNIRNDVSLTPRPGYLEFIEAGAILFVLSLIVWSRQASLTTPVRLPPGLEIAPLWRRALGMVIDLLPACLVTLPLWIEPLSDVTWLMPRLEQELAQRFFATRTMAPTYITLTFHALYCFGWEYALGTTPGKHLLGCRVYSEAGESPGVSQLLLRSALRVAELGISLVGISSLFMMVVISRNRQRIGDAMAGTLVIHGIAPVARPVARPVGTRGAASVEDSEDEAESWREP